MTEHEDYTASVCTFVSVLIQGALVSSASTSKGVQDLSTCREGAVAGHIILYSSFNDSISVVAGRHKEQFSKGRESSHCCIKSTTRSHNSRAVTGTCDGDTIRIVANLWEGALINPQPNSVVH